MGVKKRDINAGDLVRSEKQGGFNVMVALGVCAAGVGALRFVEKGVGINQDALLKGVYHPDMAILLGDGYLFQQDGAPSHAAKKVLKWVKDEGGFDLLPFPPCSPDLNPLDFSIWGVLEQAAHAKKPKSELELRCAIKKRAAELRPEALEKAVLQFGKRVDMCIEAEGGHFEY